MSESESRLRVAVISDTHGLLRDEVVERVNGADVVLHAGDVGRMEILDLLRTIAPVKAVAGNMDHGPTRDLPSIVEGELGGLPFGMVHRREDIPSPWLDEKRFVVFGHSHRPEVEWRGSCLLFNPGACGGRRFRLPLSTGELWIRGDVVAPSVLALDPT